ncbi:MAG TPA: WD40 repeat domain-containing protein [Gemmata sp.]
MRLLNGHALRVFDIAFAPDGRSLASNSLDGTVRVWDVTTGAGTVLVQIAERNQFQTRRDVPDGFDRLAFTGGGQHLICRSAAAGIEIWDIGARYRCAALVGRGFAEYGSELAATGDLVAANVWSAEPFGTGLHLWDLATQSGQVLYHTSDGGAFSGLAFDPAGRFLATNAGVFDVSTGACVLEGLLWGDVLRWSPSGELIAGGVQYEGVQVIEADTGTPVVSISLADKELPRFQFSARGDYLATVENETVQVWDTAGWVKQREFAWKVGRLTCLSFSPDGHLAAAGTTRGQILLWDWDL